MQKSIYKLGFWSSLTAFIAATCYSISHISQLIGILHYPLDEILIYGFSIFIASPFVLAMLALHYWAPEDKKIWSHAGLTLAIMYAVLSSLVYIVQLTVVIPMTLQGKSDQVAILSISRHPFMAGVDALGYFFMSTAALIASQVFSKEQLWLRRAFIAHGLLAPAIVLAMYFPVLLAIGALWWITGPLSLVLLVILFKRGIDDKEKAGAKSG